MEYSFVQLGIDFETRNYIEIGGPGLEQGFPLENSPFFWKFELP